ncbi:hypothetical protein C823_002991 [Eubacterium plexicaudatum ASF492]|uniref:Uncharacterized protein n=1 Tax=Eubacterium plexicaudatum ASF492 TaxID=1235802 RepID=N2AH10_9FIRM|nr:hypothetical protein C823_002991 [Eubacterium plexicaudatum ASF492]
MGNRMVVEGYSFTDENMAKQARTEAEGVQYVKARTDMSKPDQVFNVYHRLLQQRMFQTPVGYAYLKELQDYLKTIPGIRNEDIRPIPIADNLVVSDTRGISERWSRRLEKEQNRLRMSMVANFAFVVSILIMFLITATSGQTTILNYEKKIQDRYAQWEQQLTQREKAIREEEQELELDFDTVLDDEEEKELQELE